MRYICKETYVLLDGILVCTVRFYLWVRKSFATIWIHWLLYLSQGLEYLSFSTFWPTPNTGEICKCKKVFKFPNCRHVQKCLFSSSESFRSGFIKLLMCVLNGFIFLPPLFFSDRNLLVLLYSCTLYIRFQVMFLLTSQRMNQLLGTSYWASLNIMLQNLSKWNHKSVIYLYISECYKLGQEVVFVNFSAVNLSRSV